MNFLTHGPKGEIKRAMSIEGALSHAASMIYLPQPLIQKAGVDLKKGVQATFVYGFKAVTITSQESADVRP